MIVESVRVSEKAKTQLLTLKRRTGIQNWNVLCRWALLTSLAEHSTPPYEDIQTDSNIDMTWKTFAGTLDEAISAVIRERANRDGINPDQLPDYFKLHLHRGIAYLLNVQGDLEAMFALLDK
jgi:DNA sulfur modification protein DndE